MKSSWWRLLRCLLGTDQERVQNRYRYRRNRDSQRDGGGNQGSRAVRNIVTKNNRIYEIVIIYWLSERKFINKIWSR